MAGETHRGLRVRFLGGATDLLGIAKRAVKSIPPGAVIADDKVRDSNLVAIVFAALAVEGFLNELATLDWSSEQRPSLVDLDDRLKALRRVLSLADDHNVQPVVTLLLAHEILGRPIDRGDSPFQEYFLLKQLRDSIVHARPSTVTVLASTPVEFQSSRDKVLRALQSRGLLSSDPAKKGQPFLEWLNSPSLGRWAVLTATAIVSATLEALPQGDFKVATSVLYRDFLAQ
jgi:hypothetical protein